MTRSAIPDFDLGAQVERGPRPSAETEVQSLPLRTPTDTQQAEEPSNIMYPSMPFGFDISGGFKESSSVDQMDFTAADIGWDIDFGTMDMEAFLSIDPSQMFNSSV